MSRSQGCGNLIVLLAAFMTEIVIAGKVVGCDIGAPGSIRVEIWSAVANMTLPFVWRGWICSRLRLNPCHSDWDKTGFADCRMESNDDIQQEQGSDEYAG